MALDLAEPGLVHPHHRLAQDADELDDARRVDEQDVVVPAHLRGAAREVQRRQDRVLGLLLDHVGAQPGSRTTSASCRGCANRGRSGRRSRPCT